MTATQSQIRDAYEAVLYCLNVIPNKHTPKEENAIWSSGSSSNPRITEAILETVKTILQSALDTQKPAGDAALSALSSLVEDARSAVDLEYVDHPALANKRKYNFDRIADHEAVIRATLNGDCGGGDYSRLKSQAYVHLYTALEYSNPETIKQRIRWAIESMNGMPLTADNAKMGD